MYFVDLGINFFEVQLELSKTGLMRPHVLPLFYLIARQPVCQNFLYCHLEIEIACLEFIIDHGEGRLA